MWIPCENTKSERYCYVFCQQVDIFLISMGVCGTKTENRRPSLSDFIEKDHASGV